MERLIDQVHTLGLKGASLCRLRRRTVERLIDQVHTLGLKKASLRAREAATQQAIQAIHDACFECSRPGNQVCSDPNFECPGFAKHAWLQSYLLMPALSTRGQAIRYVQTHF